MRMPDGLRSVRPWACAARRRERSEDPAMTDATTHLWDDTVLPFQLDASDIRGRVARLDGVLEGVLSQHEYPAPIEALVAEMALLTALIGQTVPPRWKLSLQVRGDGPARLIATDYYGPGEDGQPARIRAWASYDAERMEASMAAPGAKAFDLVGAGYFAILIDQGQGTTPYQGITPLSGGRLSACAETYFAQSEQIPTRFALAYGRSAAPGGPETWRAGGVMLQHMPKASPSATGGGSGEGGLLTASDILDDDAGENWTRANVLLDTTDELELIGPSLAPTDLLLRLFHEEGPRVFEPQPVRFGCSCSADKVRQSLSIYSAKDIGHMTTEGRPRDRRLPVLRRALRV